MSIYSIQRVHLHTTITSTYNEYKLYTTSTNYIQRVLTLYNEYSYIQLRVLIHTTIASTYNEYLFYATSKFHTASTYSMQRVLTLYNDCLLYATTTLCNKYLLYAMSTYSTRRVLIHATGIYFIEEYFYIQRVLFDISSTYSIQRVYLYIQRVLVYTTSIMNTNSIRILLHATKTYSMQ